MATELDNRFDSEFASRLLLEIAQEQLLDQLLKKVVHRILERPGVARVRIWLIDKGDLCATCTRRPDCPDQTRCLHAVAGGGHRISESIDEGEYVRQTDRYARIPLGVGVVGGIGATGRQRVLRDLDQDAGELSYLEWLQPEKIRGFNGVPIIFKGEVLGVVAVFSRLNVPVEAEVWGRIFADHIAGAIANARAFEEIQRLKSNSTTKRLPAGGSGGGQSVWRSGRAKHGLAADCQPN